MRVPTSAPDQIGPSGVRSSADLDDDTIAVKFTGLEVGRLQAHQKLIENAVLRERTWCQQPAGMKRPSPGPSTTSKHAAR